MDKRVILAKAGAGKTYTLCEEIEVEKRNLIIAYTNRNINNIKKELVKRYQVIPENTVICTFHSFLYHNFIKTFESLILDYYDVLTFTSKGISMLASPQATIPRGEFRISNPKYTDISQIGHYINNNKYYVDLFSDLVMRIKKGRKYNLLKLGIQEIKKFYDCIYIDEFQDFREKDYQILEALIKSVDNILLVGDYYQHSVNAQNNSGKPFRLAGKKLVDYEQYKEILGDLGLKVDEKKLNKTRRCPKEICDFISKNLNIDLDASADNQNDGKVYILKTMEEIIKILDNDNIVKLMYNNATDYIFNSLTWGNSKGDTYSSCCVILTSTFEDIGSDKFEISYNTTINKLYVALSRTSGNLYILKYSLFKEVEDLYKKEKIVQELFDK